MPLPVAEPESATPLVPMVLLSKVPSIWVPALALKMVTALPLAPLMVLFRASKNMMPWEAKTMLPLPMLLAGWVLVMVLPTPAPPTVTCMVVPVWPVKFMASLMEPVKVELVTLTWEVVPALRASTARL